MASDSTSSQSQGTSMTSSVLDDEQSMASHGLDLHSQLPRVTYDDDELDTVLDGPDELSGEILSEIRDDIASFDADADAVNINDSFFEEEDDDPSCNAPRIHNPLYKDHIQTTAGNPHNRTAVGYNSSTSRSKTAAASATGANVGPSAGANASDGENKGVQSKAAGANSVNGAAEDTIGITLDGNSFSANAAQASDKQQDVDGDRGNDGVTAAAAAVAAAAGAAAGANAAVDCAAADGYDGSEEASVREYINRKSSLEKLRKSHSHQSADRNLKRRMLKSDSAKEGLHTASELKNARSGRSVMFHAALLLVPLVLIWTVIGTFTYRNVDNLKTMTTEMRENVVPASETSNRLVQDILRISFLVDMTAQSMDMGSAYNNYNNLIFLLKNSPVYGIPELADDVAVLRGKIDNLYKAKAHLHHDTRDIFNTWLVCYGSIENFLLLTDEHDMYREMLGHDHSSLMQGYSAFDREVTVHLKNVGRFIGPQCSDIYQRMQYTPKVNSTKDWFNRDRNNQKSALDSNLKDMSHLSKEEAQHIMSPAGLKRSEVGTNHSAHSIAHKAADKPNSSVATASLNHAHDAAPRKSDVPTSTASSTAAPQGSAPAVSEKTDASAAAQGQVATSAAVASASRVEASKPITGSSEAAVVASASPKLVEADKVSASNAEKIDSASDAAKIASATDAAKRDSTTDAAAHIVEDAAGCLNKGSNGEAVHGINTGSGVIATADVAGEAVSTATEGVLAVGEHTKIVANPQVITDNDATEVASALVDASCNDKSISFADEDGLDKHSDEVAEALAGGPVNDLGNDVAAGSAVAAGIESKLSGIPNAQPNAIGLIKSLGDSHNIAARSQLELHQKIERHNITKDEKIFYACRAFDTQYAALEVMHEHQQESLKRFNYAYSDLMSLVISMRFKVDALVKVRPATASADIERAAYTLHHNAVIVLMCAAASIFFVCVYAVYFFASPITELHRQIREFVRTGKLPNNESNQISESREILNDIMPILEDYSLLQSCSGELVSYSKALSDAEYTDELTRVHNRIALDKLCDDGRELQPMSAVMLVDIDRFAAFNSNNGTIVGDALLKEITHILQRHIFSAKDLIFRYNADSFCIVMQQCTVEEMLIFIADISKEIKKLRYKHISKHIKGFDSQPLINTDFYLSVPEPDALKQSSEAEERQRISMLDAEVASMTDSEVVDTERLNHLYGYDDKRKAIENKRHLLRHGKHNHQADKDVGRKYDNADMSMLGNDAFYVDTKANAEKEIQATSPSHSNDFDASYAQAVAAEAAQAMAATAAAARGDYVEDSDSDKDGALTENFVAVSIGVSYADDRMINTSMKLSEHIRMAVQALLSAKCKGGNNTVIYDDTGMGQRRAKLAKAAAEVQRADEEAKAIKDAKELAGSKSSSNQDLNVIVEYGEDSISVKPASSKSTGSDDE